MKFKLFLAVSFLIEIISGQEAHYGTIIDSLSLDPIPYVSLEWSSKKGTITNEQGRYRIFFESLNDSSSITISHLGYHDIFLKQNELSDSIHLVSKTYRLNEVIVVDTYDLKNKVLSNFKRNYASEEVCEAFFLKQFLKENGKYVNYLEAMGMVKNRLKPESTKVYLQGVRKTDNLITPYINFVYQNIHKLIGRTINAILQDGEITNFDWVDSNFIEASVENQETKEKHLLTIDTSDYSIRKVIKNTITNELKNKFQWETIRDEGKKIEYEGFLQGELLEYDFKKIADKYHLNRIRQRVKAVLVSKDKSIKHEFISEQLYLTTEIIATCEKSEVMKPLKRGKALRDINVKRNPEQWQELNAILPLKEQQKILDALGKAH